MTSNQTRTTDRADVAAIAEKAAAQKDGLVSRRLLTDLAAHNARRLDEVMQFALLILLVVALVATGLAIADVIDVTTAMPATFVVSALIGLSVYKFSLFRALPPR